MSLRTDVSALYIDPRGPYPKLPFLLGIGLIAGVLAVDKAVRAWEARHGR